MPTTTATYVRKQKAKILPAVKGRRKEEVTKWEQDHANANLVPRTDADGAATGAHTSWDLATPREIIMGIVVYFEEDNEGENADEELEEFQWKPREDFKTTMSRFKAIVRRCCKGWLLQSMYRGYLQVRQTLTIYNLVTHTGLEPLVLYRELLYSVACRISTQATARSIGFEVAQW